MTQVQQLSHSIRTARRMTLGLLDGITGDQWLFQPVPSGQHALWIVGHLAVMDDWAMVALGIKDRELASIEGLFGKDQPVTSEASAYPPIDELLRLFHTAHQRVLDRLDQLTDQDLSRSIEGPLAEFAPTLATLLSSHIWHEGFHAGQLALIRRALGLPLRFG